MEMCLKVGISYLFTKFYFLPYTFYYIGMRPNSKKMIISIDVDVIDMESTPRSGEEAENFMTHARRLIHV